jgi:hypothetical protein
MPPPLDELAAALGGELGAQAARIERDLKLQFAADIERLRADRAEFELRIERAVAERLASLKDGPPGPQGTPGERGESAGDEMAPDSLVPLLGHAMAILNEAPPLEAKAAPGITLNLTTPTSTHRKTITTRRDDEGNLIAEVVDVEG